MAWLATLPLQWRLGLFVLGGLLVVFGPLVLLGTLMAEDNARAMTAERLEVAELTAAYLDEEFHEEIEQLDNAAHEIALVQSDPAAVQRLLVDLLRNSEPFVVGVFIADGSGRVIAAHPDTLMLGADLSVESYVSEPLVTRASYISGVYAEGQSPRPLAALAWPILIDETGPPRGVLVATLDPTTQPFDMLMRAAEQLGVSGHAELVDQNLRLIASSERGHALGPAEHPTFYRPLLAGKITGVGLTEPIGDEDPDDRGQRHIMAFVPLTSVPWGLGIGGSESAFTLVVDRWRWQMLLLAAPVLGTVMFLVWTTHRTVVAPVRALTQTTQRLAGGDLTTPVPHLGSGEVRGLAEAFDRMRDHLREALEALAVEKSRYEAIVVSMANPVVTTDLQQRITEFNPAAEALTGWLAADALGQPCHLVLCAGGEGREDRCLCRDGAAEAAGAPSFGKQVVRRRDGRSVTVALTHSPILGADGGPKGRVYVLRDISAEEELDRLKDEFLSTVSHELRTPLGAITGYASTLLGDPDLLSSPDSARRSLRVIVGASQELNELVDNLLDMSRIGAGALTVAPQIVHLRPLARTAVEHVGQRAHSHALVVRVPVSLPGVLADPRRIQQVLYNLLDNALKYTPAGGTVSVSAVAAGGQVTVSVADDGPGIAAEDRMHVFERFYRGAAARAGRVTGTGLGMAICKGIVEAHGGRIWVDSAALNGRRSRPGAIVRFTLLVADAGPALKPRRDRTPNHHNHTVTAGASARLSPELSQEAST